jgi:hypothetical protein
MRFRSLAVAFVVLLAGCTLSSSQASNISSFLAQLGNTTGADLTNAAAIANAATPPDAAGLQCVTALQGQQANIQKLVAANNLAKGAVVSATEVSSLLIPGSAQMNAARDALVQGCGVKMAQVTGEIAGTSGWFTQLALLMQLAPAAAM